MEFSRPKKLFYTLNKTPSGETGCLTSLHYLLVAQVSSCLIQPFPQNTVKQNTFGAQLLTVQYLCELRNAMPRHWSPGTSHPTFPREAEDFPRGGKYPSAHILSLFGISLINNSRLIFICIINVFTCSEEISKLAV